VPEHYALHFAPDFNTDTFAGDETIHVRLRTPSNHVTLHAAEIDFHEVTITSAGRSQSARQARHPDHQTDTPTAPTPLDAGPASIHVTYTGYLTNKLRGFYLSRANNRKYAIT